MTPPSSPSHTHLLSPAPPCVLLFNANDPSGAGGLTADVTSVVSVGCHPLAVLTGAYARDTSDIHAHLALPEEAVAEQARSVLEDIQVQAIKVGFAGSAANLAMIAHIAADYPELPLVAYMPPLSWWHEDEIEPYLHAFAELLLPQTTVLVGSHGTLWRWLLPERASSRPPTARELAQAAAAQGVPCVLVSGIPVAAQHLDNQLCSPQGLLHSARTARLESRFGGAGDTLAATLAALLASGYDIDDAAREALSYLERSLAHGFSPGMGQALPNRMFWALASGDDEPEAEAEHPPSFEATQPLAGLELPPHDTPH
ncbi:MAG: bifunctional hydroxymethylpyrimidine kinase/phosphomethylpyrimidine kinase [Comamonadaceae bacterium]|nr:bifunctional hydroxymethylpyrimidine kinase/phosphomethylpyrimidine kinase [Comamonadaceae bacterium]